MAHLYRVEFNMDSYDYEEVFDGLMVFSPMDLSILEVSPVDFLNSETGKYIFGPDKPKASDAEDETVEAE